MSAISQLIATQANRNKGPSPMELMGNMQSLDAGKQRMAMNAQGMEMNKQRMDMNAQSMGADKRKEGMKFAANIARQMKQAETPEEKAKIYETGRHLAQMNQHDVEAFPETFSPEAEQIMEGVYQQVFEPEDMRARFLEQAPQSDIGKLMADRERIKQAGGDVTMFDEAIKAKNARGNVADMPTTSQKDFETYQSLKRSDPEAAKEFARAKGYTERTTTKLSSHMEKRLSNANDEAVESGNNAVKFNQLAAEFEEADVGKGLFTSSWSEFMKKTTGNQDAVTQLRKRYIGVKTSQAIANLPPGAASDVDVAMALKPFPADNANGAHIASFLRGLSKLESFKRDFATFRADFISKNNDEKDMLAAWKAKHPDPEEEKPATGTKYSIGQTISHGGKNYRVIGGDMNDPEIELIE